MKMKRFSKVVLVVTEMRASGSRGHGLVETEVGGGFTTGVLGPPESHEKPQFLCEHCSIISFIQLYHLHSILFA